MDPVEVLLCQLPGLVPFASKRPALPVLVRREFVPELPRAV